MVAAQRAGLPCVARPRLVRRDSSSAVLSHRMEPSRAAQCSASKVKPAVCRLAAASLAVEDAPGASSARSPALVPPLLRAAPLGPAWPRCGRQPSLQRVFQVIEFGPHLTPGTPLRRFLWPASMPPTSPVLKGQINVCERRVLLTSWLQRACLVCVRPAESRRACPAPTQLSAQGDHEAP